MGIEGHVHVNCPKCGESEMRTEPFQVYCGAQLTCQCGFPTGSQCHAYRAGVYQTCETPGCGWRNNHYDELCQDKDHGLEPCKTAHNPDSPHPSAP